MKRYLPLLACLISPLLFAAEQTLDIPRSPTEMKKYLDGNNTRCPGCAVVTDIRSLKPQSDTRQLPQASGGNLGGSGPVDETPTFTVAGTGGQAKKQREADMKPASPNWRITVRYDDGSYASFDQEEKPRMRKGDRVRVASGKVELR